MRWNGWVPRPIGLAVLFGGLTLTALLTWAAFTANAGDSDRLLKLQVEQADSALAAALPSTQTELANALAVATSTKSPATFERFARNIVAPAHFASLALWQRSGASTTMLAVVGSAPRLVADGSGAFLSGAKPGLLHVTSILPGAPRRLGYALAGGEGYIVYAETDLPARQSLKVPRTSPFGELNFAIYLGSKATNEGLLESSIPVPIHGQTASASTPFGDTVLTVVGTPRVGLTGTASSALPWIAGVAGTVLSIASAIIVEYVSRRRRRAEQLAAEVSQLYSQQRSIAETLQQALLPEVLPGVPGLEVAARYVAGVKGVDVGGDWYDVVQVSESRLIFLIGDVSGRGVKAAAVMASLRFAGRGYALEGHSPAAILERLQATLDFGTDLKFATVLCGEIDLSTSRVVLASAGHLPPILYTADGATTLAVPPAPPIGISEQTHVESMHLEVRPGSTLLAYTDGLVERRGEGIDEGIRRLESVTTVRSQPLEDALNMLLSDLTLDAPEDDVAMIGLRWQN
jgi:serine phosphatase RsbU (regulator of sigma subunit)